MGAPLADLGASFDSFFDSLDEFFSNLAAVRWQSVLLALVFFSGYLLLRSRALFHVVRAAYPDERIEWRRVGGAYVAAVGLKNLVPGGAANVVQIFLTKASIERSTFPAVTSAITVCAIFDTFVSVLTMAFAFTQGVFPKPPDFARLNAFDLSFFASHVDVALFALTALAVGILVLFAVLSTRVKAFWARIGQGVTILRDRRRYLREVAAWQAASWLCKFAAFWMMLDAFRIGGSLRNALLVQGVQVVSTIIPLSPGGAGVQQALLVVVFNGAASGGAVAAYSVGQQIVLAAFTLALGLIALVAIFRIRSFKQVIRRSRDEQALEPPGDVAGATAPASRL